MLSGKRDVLIDFRASEGDKIDLHYIDANQTTAAFDVFRIITGLAFTGLGQLRYATENGNLRSTATARATWLRTSRSS